jgi:DNA-binding response OmpR family regulator
VALCDRCGEEIAVANDLDRAGDVDRRRHVLMVAGQPRRLTATHWRIFVLLYGCRGDVVYTDRIHAELYPEVRTLRRVLDGSRYRIENYRGLGYELIVDDSPSPETDPPLRRR